MRLLSRKGVSEQDRARLVASVEERGSAYLPQVNAFYVREFQMMHAAEDAARFLHQACQGLPRRIQGHAAGEISSEDEHRKLSIDDFYARVIEHAVAYFGSRILCPSRPALEGDEAQPLSRAGCEKAAQAAGRADANETEASAQKWGYRIGGQLYDAYLAGKVAPSGLRRLFLAHLDEPGVARKVCTAALAKLRSVSKPLARAAHA
jgi:hypothetical protein